MELQGCEGDVDAAEFQAQAKSTRVACGSAIHHFSFALEVQGMFSTW
jgi:hypothetical protein